MAASGSHKDVTPESFSCHSGTNYTLPIEGGSHVGLMKQ